MDTLLLALWLGCFEPTHDILWTSCQCAPIISDPYSSLITLLFSLCSHLIPTWHKSTCYSIYLPQILQLLNIKSPVFLSDDYCIYRLPRVDDLKEQVYEVDTDIEQGDLVRPLWSNSVFYITAHSHICFKN